MEWKRIKEVDNGVYEVNNTGTVIRRAGAINVGKSKRLVPELIMKPRLMFGYYTFTFKVRGKGKTFRRGRLVATYFVPNPNNLPEVNHIDGIKINDYYENLEWTTRQGNVDHANSTGLVGKIVMKKYGKSSLSKSVAQYSLSGKLIKIYDSMRRAEDETGFNNAGISKACSGHLKTYKGYQWQELKNKQP